MKRLYDAFSCEALKVMHSKIVWITFLAFLIVPFIGGFFMLILKDPEVARSYGLIGAKAQLTVGTADWISYFEFLAQAVSIGGLFVFGFVSSWVFGREYSDRTVKDLLALPISRTHIVGAKFITILLWCIILSAIVLMMGLWVGNMVALPGWSRELVVKGCEIFAISSILTIALSSPVAFFACVGRGYLAPLGFVVFTLILANIVAVTGYGEFFPWAVPALYSQVAGEENALPGSISYLLVILTSFAGLIGTICWWRYADHT
ncbi:bacitracin abc transporter, permease protein [hydrocarbon metagenome]|uniref:Bacitracin abc transporter, permease protein n=1 Tax=hydrocarbon metagenome TaxID=938273 RepID=A0A0W8E1Y8_9ZZZZ